MAVSASANVALAANSRKFDTGIKAATRSTTKFKNKANKNFKSVQAQSRLSSKAIVGHMKAAGAALIASFGIAKLKSIGDGFDELAKTARSVNLSTGDWFELSTVLGTLGIEAGQAKKALFTLQKQIGDAESGLGSPIQAFKDLGIAVSDFDGLNTKEAFELVADAIREVGPSAKTTAASMLILGKTAQNLGTLIGLTTEQYDSYSEAIRDRLIKPNEDAAGSFESFNDEFDLFNTNIGTLIGNLLGLETNDFTKQLEDLNKYLAKHNEAITETIKKWGSILALAAKIYVAGKLLTKGFAAITAVSASLATTTGTLTRAFVALRAAFIATPFGAAAAAAYVLYEVFEAFPEATKAVMDGIRSLINSTIEGLLRFNRIALKILNVVTFGKFDAALKASTQRLKDHLDSVDFANNEEARKAKEAADRLLQIEKDKNAKILQEKREKAQKEANLIEEGGVLARLAQLTVDDLNLEKNKAFLDGLSTQHQDYLNVIIAQKIIFAEKERQLEETKTLSRLTEQQEYVDAERQINDVIGADIEKSDKEQQAKLEKKNALIANAADTLFGQLAETDEKGFKLNQAYQIGQAIVNTYGAANKALATLPPPLSFAAAAASVVAGLINVAKIKSQKFNAPKRFGGRVEANLPGLVGENGAELFVPETNGTIIPNPADGGEFGGQTYQDITIQVGPGASPSDVSDSISDGFRNLLNNGSIDTGGVGLFPQTRFA